MDNEYTNQPVDQADSVENKSCNQDAALVACKQDLEKLKNSYLHLSADFENSKKRMEKERQQWVRNAQTSLLIGLLPIVDNFERALAEKEKEDRSSELDAWFSGFALIAKELSQYLLKIGVTPVPAGNFDPEFHEAVFTVESDKGSGEIVEVLQKGYMFDNHVLRPAKVSISK